MAIHTVLIGPVEHNGTAYAEGSMLPDLTEDQAAQLLEIGAIALSKASSRLTKQGDD